MKNFTLKKLARKKEGLLLLAMFALLFVFGCYEFTSIIQPTEAYNNSSFDVSLVMKEDADDSNDWTSEAGDMVKAGLFGVLIPEGWTVDDNIAFHVKSKASDLNGSGEEVTATSDHSADYTMVYNAEQSTMLADSVGAPAGYVWWGARSSTDVDMAFFDSLYFTITINTDAQLGDFYLQYTVGDVDYWERTPVHYKSEPMMITITQNVGVMNMLTEDAVSVYPNPSYGMLNLQLENFNGDEVNARIYSMNGQEVMNHQVNAANSVINVVSLNPGAYVLRLESGEEVFTQKFIRK